MYNLVFEQNKKPQTIARLGLFRSRLSLLLFIGLCPILQKVKSGRGVIEVK